MAMSESKHQFRDLCDSLKTGDITRRQFMNRATALGVAAGTAVFAANATAALASGKTTSSGLYFAAQDGTATPAAGGAAAPSTGTESQTRGAGGELRIIQWQAATMLFSHKATGTKDFLCSDIILEPLFRYLPSGEIIGALAETFPSVDAGTLAEDLTSATVTLKPGILWSDGTPFTAKDVVFTWQWNTTETNNSINLDTWRQIANVEAVDDLTVTFTFVQPSAAWADPLVGGILGHIIPSHVFGDDPANANDAFLTAPIGTGPYILESFVPNDQVIYAVNENYREANKPYFSSVNVKGGGDAASAARAVLQTGEYDYCWNLQVEPAVLESLISDDGPGTLEIELGTSLERIHINFSDPNTEVDGQRSEMNTPHPFLTDPAVRQALNKAVPRQVIADEFYGNGMVPTANALNGLDAFVSPNTSWEFNLDAAAAILDEAGWSLDGDVRSKDGVELRLSYATSINPARQKNQQVVKQAFESIGVKVQLEQIDAGIFFDSGAGNEQNINHFYWDINMYTNSTSTPVPINFLQDWYSGTDRDNIAQASNEWTGTNRQRWVNADFDTAFEQLKAATTLEEAFALSIECNDIMINEVVIIPEVNRAADVYGISKRLIKENVALGVGFELNYWNIANWTTVEQ
ncbi:MAG: peptide ABC transporter substrate-binding protein [Thermomicrobiales bacterium]